MFTPRSAGENRFSAEPRLSARRLNVAWNEFTFVGVNVYVSPNVAVFDRSNTATFGDTYTFTPTKVNSFHATFNRRADNRGSALNLFSPNDLGVNMFDNLPNYIQLTISNYFNVACGTCAPGYFNINTFQVSNDFTWIKGRHQLAFG